MGEAHVGEGHGAGGPAAHRGGRDGAMEHPVAMEQGHGAQQRREPRGELAQPFDGGKRGAAALAFDPGREVLEPEQPRRCLLYTSPSPRDS